MVTHEKAVIVIVMVMVIIMARSHTGWSSSRILRIPSLPSGEPATGDRAGAFVRVRGGPDVNGLLSAIEGAGVDAGTAEGRADGADDGDVCTDGFGLGFGFGFDFWYGDPEGVPVRALVGVLAGADEWWSSSPSP